MEWNQLEQTLVFLSVLNVYYGVYKYCTTLCHYLAFLTKVRCVYKVVCNTTFSN